MKGFQRAVHHKLTTTNFWMKLLIMKGHKESLPWGIYLQAPRGAHREGKAQPAPIWRTDQEVQGDLPGANLQQQDQSGKKYPEVPPLPILFYRCSFLLAVSTQWKLLNSQHSTHMLKFYLYCSEDFEQSDRKLSEHSVMLPALHLAHAMHSQN